MAFSPFGIIDKASAIDAGSTNHISQGSYKHQGRAKQSDKKQGTHGRDSSKGIAPAE